MTVNTIPAVTHDSFTTKGFEAVSACLTFTRELGQRETTPEHLLYQLLKQEGLAVTMVEACEANPQTIKEQVTQHLESTRGRVVPTPKTVSVAPNLAWSRMLTAAMSEAAELTDEFISVEHLMLALCNEGVGKAREILHQNGVTREKMLASLTAIRGYKRITSKDQELEFPALRQFGRDLTELAAKGKLDPVIGRQDEIRRVVQVLSRRTKNNPLLVGEPGIGKTAIVEGLAQRIVKRDVPESMQGKKLFTLDIGALLAGASQKGEFGKRLKAVMEEVIKSNGEIMLFIDEIHTLVGAGGGGGEVDAGNLLKPSLARGELHCIGATTFEEFRKNIEKDKALARRFQKVVVDEPTVSDTVSILRGIKRKYELHHGVRIRDAALEKAASLSARYITDRFLPDKAIDLMDEAAARLRILIDSVPEDLDNLERERDRLEIEKNSIENEKDEDNADRLAALTHTLADITERASDLRARWVMEKESMQKIRAVKGEIEQLDQGIEEAKRTLAAAREKNPDGEEVNQALRHVAELVTKRKPELEAQLHSLTAAPEGAKRPRLLKEEVNEADIAEIVFKWTGIPVNKMLEGDEEKLLDLEGHLNKRVIAQMEAKAAVASAIRRSRSGIADPNKPIGSFIFLGPTGVGKTELTKALAEFLFDDEAAMVRIDMSEYMEKHSVARLVGAPPGYVGYDEGGQLTEAVRKRPYCVVLFDEIEKAHPDVFNILLQVLDDGRLTDGQGRTVDFRNVIVVMTSNIGSDLILASDEDYEHMKNKVVGELNACFRPEFLNRVGEIVCFHRLLPEMMGSIAGIQLGRLEKRVKENRSIVLTPTPEAIRVLAAKGYDPAYGARPVKRVVEKQIEDALAIKLLKKEFVNGDTVELDFTTDGWVFRKKVADAEAPAAEPALAAAPAPDVVEAAVAAHAEGEMDALLGGATVRLSAAKTETPVQPKGGKPAERTPDTATGV